MALPEYVRHPDFNPNTKVVVIDKANENYGKVGLVTDIVPCRSDFTCISDYKSCPEAVRHWKVCVDIDGHPYTWFFPSAEHALEPVQKKFIDIEHLREHDIAIGDAVRKSNAGAFEPGDQIQITTKVDGANASIAWNTVKEKLDVFSRTNLLEAPDGLRGFVSYVKTKVEPKVDMSKFPEMVVFGEWLIPHTVKYNDDAYGKWYVYDIWDKNSKDYFHQDVVKKFCDEFKLNYVEELYRGPFIDWDHCRSFIGKSTAYGPAQEGVVVKNLTKLHDSTVRFPKYIKIVDEKFKESMDHKSRKKEVDPEKQKAYDNAVELMSSVVTEARAQKIVMKLVDEGILPAELTPRDMGTAMKHLPKRVFEDVLKEEPEAAAQAGEYAGKVCSMLTAKLARKLLVGG